MANELHHRLTRDGIGAAANIRIICNPLSRLSMERVLDALLLAALLFAARVNKSSADKPIP